MPVERPPRRAARVAAATLLAAIFVTATGCSEEPTDPVQARRDRVQARLEDTFSRQQADCILEQLDDDQLAAIDAAPSDDTSTSVPDLDDAEVLEAYSNAAVACVVGLGS